MSMTSQMPLLVIEDSDEDFEVLQILMEDMAVHNPIYRCATGDRALDFIARCKLPAANADVVCPSMILLDLNLPGVDGREVLSQLKQDKRLQEVPVVIFTTSSDPIDIRYCYQNGANGYLIKPVGIEALEQKVQAFVDYWLRANTTLKGMGEGIASLDKEDL